MKKSILPLTCVLLIVLLFTSCSKTDSGNIPSKNNSNQPDSVTIDGSYVLSSFRQKTEDKANKFDGYVFTFTTTESNSGTVTATKNSSTVRGTWMYKPAVTYYGSTSKTSITLSMGLEAPFTSLNKVWNVDSTSTSSKLVLSSPELRENEHLEFTKQ